MEVRRIVQHAQDSVPAYRDLFKSIGFDARDIKSLHDFSQLPITTKSQVQDCPERFVSDAIPKDQLKTNTTSGSTGTPLQIRSTARTTTAERAIMYRNWRWAGYESGDKVFTCIGDISGKRLGPDYAPYTLHRNEIEVLPDQLDDRSIEYYVELMRSFKPDHFRAYTGIANIFWHFMEDRGLKPPPLKSLWTQSEIFTKDNRRKLEAFYNAKLNDYYGMQEKCVAMGECEEGRMHVYEDFCFVELLESPRPPVRRIISTGFFNEAMPLLRYETRDNTIPYADPCPCGRAFPTVRGITGRYDDYIVRVDGTANMDIETLLQELGTVRECQVIQESLLETYVLVVPGIHFDPARKAPFEKLMAQDLGEGVRVEVRCVDEIPKSASGKRRLTISNVPYRWDC